MLLRQAARTLSVSAQTWSRSNGTATNKVTRALQHKTPTPNAYIRAFSVGSARRAEIGSKNNTTPKSQPGPRLEGSDPSNPVPKPAENPESANEELRGPQDPDLNSEPSQPLPDLRYGIPSSFDADAPTSTSTKTPDTDGSRPRGDKEYGGRDYKGSEYETSTDRRRARLANYMYISLAGTAVLGTVFMARPFGQDESTPSGVDPNALSGWSPGAIWTRIKARSWGTVEQFAEPTEKTLLLPPPLKSWVDAQGRMNPGDPENVLVMSLDDLLVNTSWSREHGFRFAKRPGIDAFLQYVLSYYELVLYSTALEMNGRPIMAKLDPYHFFADKYLFRDFTRYDSGEHVKDLSYLGRPLDKMILIDTKAAHAKYQPENAIILPKWNGDAKDPHAGDLLALIPLLQYAAESNQDVRKVLASFKPTGSSTTMAQEFAKREMALREKAKTDSKARAAVQIIDKQRALGREKFDVLVAAIAKDGAATLEAEKEAMAADIEMQMKEAKKAYLGWIPGYSTLVGGDAPGPSNAPGAAPGAGAGK